MTGIGCGAIVSVSVLPPVPNAFVAPRSTTNVPDWVGVPLMRPVEVFTVSPAGKGAAL